MNETSVTRIWKWAVILLVLCNAGLITTILLKPAMHQGPHETPRDFVIRNLQFTGDQTKQYDLLIKDHQGAMRRLRHEAMDYRQALFASLKNGSQNNINPDSIAQLIANNQKQIEIVTYQHFRQVRTLCTEAQKTDFDKIIGDVIKQMNGPGHGGPPPPGGPGPEGNPPPVDREGPPPPPDSR